MSSERSRPLAAFVLVLMAAVGVSAVQLSRADARGPLNLAALAATLAFGGPSESTDLITEPAPVLEAAPAERTSPASETSTPQAAPPSAATLVSPTAKAPAPLSTRSAAVDRSSNGRDSGSASGPVSSPSFQAPASAQGLGVSTSTHPGQARGTGPTKAKGKGPKKAGKNSATTKDVPTRGKPTQGLTGVTADPGKAKHAGKGHGRAKGHDKAKGHGKGKAKGHGKAKGKSKAKRPARTR